MVMRIPFVGRLRLEYGRRQLHRQIRSARPLNIVIGGGQTSYAGWTKTDRDILDITKADDWAKLFEPESIDRILCEHVLEHLTEADCKVALAQCYRHLRPGALIRIAVPDGYRRDAAYVAEASPPKDGHEVLYNIESLTRLLEWAGLVVTPLEYFDAAEQFHARDWNESDGFIMRSVRFDTQKDFQRGELYYTSLIVDARKPS